MGEGWEEVVVVMDSVVGVMKEGRGQTTGAGCRAIQRWVKKTLTIYKDRFAEQPSMNRMQLRGLMESYTWWLRYPER